LALGAHGGLRAALERGVPEPRDLKRLLVELQRTVVIRLPPPRWNVLRRDQPLGVVGSARDLLGLVRELASEIRVALRDRRARFHALRLRGSDGGRDDWISPARAGSEPRSTQPAINVNVRSHA
jgi:hypothetical protein